VTACLIVVTGTKGCAAGGGGGQGRVASESRQLESVPKPTLRDACEYAQAQERHRVAGARREQTVCQCALAPHASALVAAGIRVRCVARSNGRSFLSGSKALESARPEQMTDARNSC